MCSTDSRHWKNETYLQTEHLITAMEKVHLQV